jgi:hypothetical protein
MTDEAVGKLDTITTEISKHILWTKNLSKSFVPAPRLDFLSFL